MWSFPSLRAGCCTLLKGGWVCCCGCYWSHDRLGMQKVSHRRTFRDCWWKFLYILFVRFNGHFSRWTWVGRYQNVSILDLLELRMMEVAVTTGAIIRSKLRSNCHRQQTNTQLFYRPDALPVAQPTMSKHWREEVCVYYSIEYRHAQY